MKFGTGLVDSKGNRRKKFGIVGFAESSRHLAPFDDDSWCLAAMNQLYRHIPRADVWFEMHQRRDFLKDQVPGTDYLAWLKSCPIPIYMIERNEDIPNAVRFPIEKMIDRFGDYFHSTISYMIAYAIEEGFEEIGIWGVDLSHDSEYEYQKPSAEYLLGVAKGLGIKITIASQSALLKTAYRYGYEEMVDNKDIQWLEVYKSRVTAKLQEVIGMCNQFQGQLVLAADLKASKDKVTKITEALNQHAGMANQLQGQLNCAEEFLQWARSKRRGSAPPPTDLPNPDQIAKNNDELDRIRLL